VDQREIASNRRLEKIALINLEGKDHLGVRIQLA
jgi:hypothetical protein